VNDARSYRHNGPVGRVGQCAKVDEIYVSWGSFWPLTIPEEAREYDICFVIREGEKEIRR